MTEADAVRAALDIQLEALPPIPRGGVLRIVHNAGPDLFGSVIEAIAESVGHREFLIVSQRPGDTLEVLDEQEMAKAGWVRADRLEPIKLDRAPAEPRLTPLAPGALAEYGEDPEQP